MVCGGYLISLEGHYLGILQTNAGGIRGQSAKLTLMGGLGRGRLISCEYVDNQGVDVCDRKVVQRALWKLLLASPCRSLRRLSGDCQLHEGRSDLIKQMPAPGE